MKFVKSIIIIIIITLIFLSHFIISSNEISVSTRRNIFDDVLLQLSEPANKLLNASLSPIMAGWIDLILEDVRKNMRDNGLNEIEIPPEKVEFSRKVLGIKWYGEASIVDGIFKGLDTIRRTGDVDIITELTGDVLADVEVGIDNPSIHARLSAKFMNLGPTTICTGTFDKVRIKMKVRVSMKMSGLHAELEEFEIIELGKLTMDVKGLGGVLNYLVENVVETLGSVFKQKLRELLQGTIKELIKELLQNPASIPDIFNVQSTTRDNNI